MSDERFDWDEANANHIWDRHGVGRMEAEQALDDSRRIAQRGSRSLVERRFRVIGKCKSGRILFVVYVTRIGRVRVVTARDASEEEKRRYRRGRK